MTDFKETKQYREVKLIDRFPSEFGRYNFKAKHADVFVGDNYMTRVKKQEYLSMYESWLEEYDSKAPEMLKMLKETVLDFEEADLQIVSISTIDKIKQLIKEATNI